MCTIPAMKGVCDTPLHLFANYMDNTMVKRDDWMLVVG